MDSRPERRFVLPVIRAACSLAHPRSVNTRLQWTHSNVTAVDLTKRTEDYLMRIRRNSGSLTNDAVLVGDEEKTMTNRIILDPRLVLSGFHPEKHSYTHSEGRLVDLCAVVAKR